MAGGARIWSHILGRGSPDEKSPEDADDGEYVADLHGKVMLLVGLASARRRSCDAVNERGGRISQRFPPAVKPARAVALQPDDLVPRRSCARCSFAEAVGLKSMRTCLLF